LEQKFNNSIHANVGSDGVAKSTVFERGENARRGDFVFGVTNTGGGANGENSHAEQVFEEGFDGVEFAADTFESIFLIFERLFELF